MKHAPLVFNGNGCSLTLITLVCLITTAIGQGCSKKDLSEIADSISEKGESFVKESRKLTDSLVNEPEQPPTPTGELELQFDTPVRFEAANVQVFCVGYGRPNSLQLLTYDASADRLPDSGLLIEAATEIETVALLVGKTLACNLFVATGYNRPVLSTSIETPVEVRFDAMNFSAGTVTGTILPCSLKRPDGEMVELSGGTFTAIMLSE
ncbi:hypothetical protein C2E31_13430 [Rhodopirellula baltica]|nr:hypothetical protein C2E31_13430 [Rhodopirellula baltica]